MDLFSPRLFHLRNPARKLEQLLHDKKSDVWILYQCPPPVQAWFADRMTNLLERPL